MRLLKNGIIVIRQLMTEDAGTYVCTAVNAAGATTIPVVLEVHGKAYFILNKHFNALCQWHAPMPLALSDT